jgi:uncharacterized Zn ribbon protein
MTAKDSNGNALAADDSVLVIKDLLPEEGVTPVPQR